MRSFTAFARIGIAAALLATLPSPSQTHAADPAPPNRFRITGVTVDDTGNPVADVALRVRPKDEPFATRSGADGRFVLEYDRPGGGYLPGFIYATTIDGTRQTLHTFKPKSVGDEGIYADVRVVLKAPRELPVAVADADGNPVAGARVRGITHYLATGESTTGDDGKAVLRVPAGEPLHYVLADKPKVGLDYLLFRHPQDPRTDAYRLPPDSAGPLNFVLAGMKDVAVRAVDDQGLPLKGIGVSPWYYELPKKGDSVVLPSREGFLRTTDERGIAAFEVPANNRAKVTFWTHSRAYVPPERPTWDPASGAAEVPAKMLRRVHLAGRVLDETGQPAARATVHVSGDGYTFDDFREQIDTGPDGGFEILVDPDMYYMLVAVRERTASEPRTQVIRAGEAPDPVELKLAPATRVFGKLTAGKDDAAAADGFVSLTLREDGYRRLPAEQQFPGGMIGRKSIMPSLTRHTTTKPDGSFEFFVGPGAYSVWSSSPDARGRPFDVKGESEVEVNLHADQERPATLAGRVVLRDEPNTGVADAEVQGAAIGVMGRTAMRSRSGPDGAFAMQREPAELYVHAASVDGMLRGVVRVPKDATTATIPVGPTAAARGRVVDADGKPIAGLEIRYGIRVEGMRGMSSQRFGGESKSAEDGTFSLDGLVPGFEYELSATVEYNADGHGSAFRHVGRAKPERAAETIELGDLKSQRPPGPGL